MASTGSPAEKHCDSCGRPIEPRRRWMHQWREVRYCSSYCRRRGVNATDRGLEREILKKKRTSCDVPGAEVPLRFLDFVTTGDRQHLDGVIYHNRIDLTTLAVLYPLVTSTDPETPAETDPASV